MDNVTSGDGSAGMCQTLRRDQKHAIPKVIQAPFQLAETQTLKNTRGALGERNQRCLCASIRSSSTTYTFALVNHLPW